jgi:hypothetical protein
MVFEIESTASNSASYNVVKVFGPNNSEYEKPLFFFHIFCKGGEDSSRIRDLTALFGTHNYRTYRLVLGEQHILLRDIITQHRRVSRRFPIELASKWLASCETFRGNLLSIVRHILRCDFHEDCIVALARLFKHNHCFEPVFRDGIIELHTAIPTLLRAPAYETYIGIHYWRGFHFALIQAWTADKTERWAQAFADWQENDGYLSMIGPHFGLSRDYDEFIFTTAPSLLALFACLMKSSISGARYVARMYLPLLKALDAHPSDASMFLALWSLQVSAAFDVSDVFELASRHINEKFGGVPENLLYFPPLSIWPNDNEAAHVILPLVTVPNMDEFSLRMSTYLADHNPSDVECVELAVDYLIGEFVDSRYSRLIQAMLHREARAETAAIDAEDSIER